MSTIQFTNPPEQFNHIQMYYFASVNEENLGRAILMATLMEVALNPDLYKITTRHIKTTLRRLKFKEDENFQVICNVNNYEDLNAYFQNPRFYEFLGNIGSSLVSDFNPTSNFTKIQHLSKDLNAKINLYQDTKLISEGISYEFENPVNIYIVLSKKDNTFWAPYFFKPNAVPQPQVLVNLNSFSALSAFGWEVGQVLEACPINRNIKQWLNVVLRDHSLVRDNFSFIKVVLDAQEKIGKIPMLLTSRMDLAEMKVSHSYLSKVPDLFERFATVPEDNIVENEDSDESGEYSDDDPDLSSVDMAGAKPLMNQPSGGDGVPQVNVNLDGKSVKVPIDEAQDDDPRFLSKVHCAACASEPIGQLDCKCSLSIDCLGRSISSKKCINCNANLSQNNINQYSGFF